MQQKMLSTEVGTQIRSAREARRLSIRELSRRSGVSAGQVSRIESGETARPSRDTLHVLADALGADPIPLLFLAGHLTEEEALPHLKQMMVAIGDLRDVSNDITDQLSDEFGHWYEDDAVD